MRIRYEYLFEETRGSLLRRSRYQSKTRYQKRLNYTISDFRGLDLKELFENDVFLYNTPIKDYICTIKFPGALTEIKKALKGVTDINKVNVQLISKALVKAYNNADDMQVSCTCPDFCLHPKTEIKLLSGEVITVEEMLKRHQDGEDLWVYSTDDVGDFKPGHVNDVWIKGYVNDFVKVTLDNGQSILTTPEHMYMRRNGEYAEAKDLLPGDSLMPLYFINNVKGYELVKINSDTKAGTQSVYKIVANEILQKQIEEAKIRSGEDTIAIHHKDFNKLNNNPSNLYPMGKQEHWTYHSNFVSKRWKEDPVFAEKSRNAASKHCYKMNANPSEKMKKARSELGKARCAEFNSGEKKKQLDEHRSACQLKYWYSMTPEERVAENARRAKSLRTEEGRKRLGESQKKVWENYTDEQREERSKKNALNLNGENGEKASKRMKEYWASFSPEDRRQIAKKRINKKFLEYACQKRDEATKKKMSEGAYKLAEKRCEDVLKYLVDEGYSLTKENYDKFRRLVNYNSPTLTTVNRHFGSFEEMLKHFNYDNYNHRIVNIERVVFEEPVPVYDIEVDKWNNFYVNAGVILHNCYRYSFWATRGGYSAGAPERRPAKITNPNNNIGAVCKHLDLLLSNHAWVTKTASVITQFIKAFPEKASLYLLGKLPDTKPSVKKPRQSPLPVANAKDTDTVTDEETPEV